MNNFWAITRIFEYLLVIFLAIGLVKRSHSFVMAGNIMVAGYLMFNAINYVLGVPNSPAFQVSFTLIVGLWAVLHFLEIMKKG